MPSRPALEPADFEVNGSWLAFRVNRVPVRSPEGEHDVFVLQDAASLLILGAAIAPHEAECPSQTDVLALMRKAWEARQEWPQELILCGRPSKENAFARVAGWNGIRLRAVPESQLSLFIKHVQASFEERLSTNDPDDA